ncbi:hypothetical protein M422DRAFT_249547 [Sphaerobolus stellatus SS14]|uniref:Uncharacterized protein n=1 Tax=Sphaerobolus stellatus (strain SS14) TaxID=990650 RepID=A0A0C9W3U7_SPHS4|nr:hypothetical protein M422DRAFT_249547 [Sphaerobolus stellatus SS14]
MVCRYSRESRLIVIKQRASNEVIFSEHSTPVHSQNSTRVRVTDPGQNTGETQTQGTGPIFSINPVAILKFSPDPEYSRYLPPWVEDLDTQWTLMYPLNDENHSPYDIPRDHKVTMLLNTQMEEKTSNAVR